ncbi:MAG TPA: formate/nitrite transporter family protein [Terriglobales bacterium]|nr:formate/nitrite transporter family protein [Terriglobales bacterium]
MPEQAQREEQISSVNLDSARRSAHDILEGASENGRQELKRPTRALALSGVAGGMTMGLTGMAVAIAQASLGRGRVEDFVAFLFYPVGFIAVIIGRAQLFTENTLYPVVLVLSEKRFLLNTLRLWAVVFGANVLGAAAFAFLAVRTGALRHDFTRELVRLGEESANIAVAEIFWTGVVGGWLIALVAWMVTASHWTIGQIVVIWLLTFVVGLGRFAHCIAATGEILAAVFAGSLPFFSYIRWIIPATLGNIVGGVFIVSLLNWGQVKADGDS